MICYSSNAEKTQILQSLVDHQKEVPLQSTIHQKVY